MSQMACWPVAHQRQVPQLGMNEQTTWSPGCTRVTPGPTSSMIPAPSWPPSTGAHGSGMSPVSRWSSEWQTPDAASLISASCSFGGSSSISSTLHPERVPGSQSSAPRVFIYFTAAPAATGRATPVM